MRKMKVADTSAANISHTLLPSLTRPHKQVRKSPEK